MNISTIVKTMQNTLSAIESPASTLPPFLLKCISLKRKGISAYRITSNVIKNNNAIGIPTGPNADGTDNMVNQFAYNIVKCIVDDIKKNGSVQVAIPMESLLVQATGANAGGAVTCVGTNLLDSISKGIIR